MKNIMILVPSLGIGGRERIAINTATCLKDKYNVYLTTFQRQVEEYENSVERYDLKLPAKYNSFTRLIQQLRRCIRLYKICKAKKIDCIFSLGQSANLTNILTCYLLNKKSIVSIHGFAEVYKGRINAFIFNYADKIICISKEMEYQLLRLYPNLKNSIVIENGYEIDKYIYPKYNKKQLEVSFPKLVAMGRLEYVKGFDRLIKAFSLLIKEIPNAQLTIIGTGSLEEKLRKISIDEGIIKNIHFMGYLKNPYDELKKHDILVMTSHNEGFPNTLIEALACQLCIVSVDCLSGPREILSKEYTPIPVKGIKKEKYGILVENLDNEENLINLIKNAIIELINDNNLRKSYMENGPVRSKMFSLENYKVKIKSLIDSMFE